MPKRPPTLAERLRSAWAQKSAGHTDPSPGAAAPARPGDPSSEFADRLRAAMAARH